MKKRIVLGLVFLLLVQIACSVSVTPTEVSAPISAATETQIPTALPPTSTPPPTPTVEPSSTPTQAPPSPSGWIVYIGADANVWLVDSATGDQRQLTQDGINWKAEQPNEILITYEDPQWSSDGKLLAYERQEGKQIQDGYDYQFDLWVYDLSVGQARPVLSDQQTAGFAWKPGASLIAYGTIIDTQYFLTQDSQYANGIWAVDLESGDNYELVPPQNGKPLIGPHWSPDGRFLGFDEVLYMEGSGNFAYYDFEAQKYTSWEEPIGSYAWSPDSSLIAYDKMVYTPLGDERIWLNTLGKDNERVFSPPYERGYSFNPVFSPQGDRVAYLSNMGGPESTLFSLFVVDVTGKEGPSLGSFEQTWVLDWSPDGKWLVLNRGPYDNQEIVIVSAADGWMRALARGGQPAWQPESR
jgi:Tol biopolymer transport system component